VSKYGLALAVREWSNHERWVLPHPTPEGWLLDWHSETIEDDELLSVLETSRNTAYPTCDNALAAAGEMMGLAPIPFYTAEQVEEAVKLAVTVPSLVSLTIREQDVIKREFLRYLTRRDET
jgi:hypothetical protein